MCSFALGLVACGGGEVASTSSTDSNTAASTTNTVTSDSSPDVVTLSATLGATPASAEEGKIAANLASQLSNTTNATTAVPDQSVNASDLFAGSVQSALASSKTATSKTAANSPQPSALSAAAVGASTAQLGSAGNLIGGASATVAPVVTGCAQVNAGYVYNTTTVAAGSAQCYQFVVGSSASKIDNLIALPSGVTGNAYLFYVEPSTGQLTTLLDSDQSPNSPMLVQAIAQNARLVLAIVPASGTGGQTFQFGVFNRGTGYDSYEANDKASNPTNLALNQTITASIDVPGIDQDYYFYPLSAGQTSVELLANFSTNQSVWVRPAFKTSTGSYSWGTEQPLTTGTVAVNAYTISGLLPAGTQFGVIVRVSGIKTTAPAKETYTLRVAGTNAGVAVSPYTIQENITYLYPSYTWQAYGAIGATAYVDDGANTVLAGEMVEFRIYPDTDSNSSYYYSFFKLQMHKVRRVFKPHCLLA